MKKTLLTAFILVTFNQIFAQDEQSFYPLEIGQSKTLTWYKSQYKEVITDTTNINSKTYFIVSQQFSNNSIDLLMRESGDTVYYYNEVQEKETIFFGIQPTIGLTIGDGTVTGIGKKLKTPKGKLTELLEVEMTYSNGQKDTRYYQKGIGLVGVKNSKGLICYLLSN